MKRELDLEHANHVLAVFAKAQLEDEILRLEAALREARAQSEKPL